ncbi:8281_t:CDS:1, partial [Ambispora leptoticha]
RSLVNETSDNAKNFFSREINDISENVEEFLKDKMKLDIIKELDSNNDTIENEWDNEEDSDWKLENNIETGREIQNHLLDISLDLI